MIKDLNMKDARFEKKFVITEFSKKEVESLIRLHPYIFSEAFYERYVNNIYFDSVDLKSYYDNLAGISERMKVRIRWYGNLTGKIEKPVLELKYKENEFGWKFGFPLKGFKVDSNLSVENLYKIFNESNLPFWVMHQLKLFTPTLLNSYKRKYYISHNKKFRMTIDSDQIFYNIGRRNNNFTNKIVDKNNILVELKCSKDDFNSAEKVMQSFPFRLIANSKYINGLNYLNVI